ncbi:MAG: YqaA family protein [Pseudomonadota bacterium]
MFTALYDRALKWAAHRNAERYLAGLSMAESVFFPIPPDVMLAPMVLAQRARAWRLAALTTVASVLGGLIGYLIGSLALEAIFPLIEQIGYQDKYQAAVEAFGQYGIWFVIVAGFTPIPFKIITIAGGALAMGLPGFIVGSLIGRGARFFLVAGIIWSGGERAADHLRRWVDTIGWTVIAIATIVALVWWWL